MLFIGRTSATISMRVQPVFIVAAIFAVASAEKGEPCTTPNEKSGTCVPLNTCQAVFSAAATKNTNAHEFARKSKCGYDNEQLVCCESPGPVIEPNFETKALPDKTTCGLEKEQPRIFGGEVAALAEFPWVVAIEFVSKRNGEKKGPLCGGSLISNRYVMTAAHCLVTREYEPVSVVLGEFNVTSDPDCVKLLANVECADAVLKVPVKQAIPHPLYDHKTGNNDLGLILLESEVQFTDFIKPVCLPFPDLPSPEPGSHSTVAGWGKTEEGSTSDVLRKVALPIVSNGECTEKLKAVRKVISAQQLCAGGEGGKDSCSGDAGGPLMRIYEDKASGKGIWYQDGVVSQGVKCGSVGFPAIYTRVSSYMDWIINVISED